MKKLNKTVKINIDPKFSASDWQLYSFRDDPAMREMSKAAAKAINRALKIVVAVEASRDVAFETVYNVMSKYSGCGATDTEPRGMLLDILNDIYG
jgi:hypothetical protein